jgi:PAS domain S-box-containing protein
MRDMSPRKEAEEALRETQRDLNHAQQLAHTGSWRLDVRRNELLWSDETYRMFGIPKGTPLTYELFLAAVHSEDKEFVDRCWTAALGGAPYDLEHRIVVGDAVKWVHERAELEFDENGELSGGFGAVQDITERKQAEEARRRGEENLASVLTSVGRLQLFERRKAWQVLLIGAALQVALFVGVDQLGSPSRYLGIPGAAAALLGVLAAITGGPLTGTAVALAGGAAYFAFLTDFGRLVVWPAIVGSILLWALAAAVAGLAGEWVRHNAAQRERLLAHMLAEREALTDSLGAANEQFAAQAKELVAKNEELQEAQAVTARLFEEQNSLLRRIQEALVDIPQELPGVKFAHLYRSATQQAQVGGDFYDVFEAKHRRVGLLIGDVSGHGVEAARIATLVKDTVHAFAHQFRRPHLVLRETNRLLVEKGLPGFVTAFLGFLDLESGTFTYSSAGHPPPLVATNGQTVFLASIGSPLGVFADARYRDNETDIQEGSLLLLYTDGITEARRDGDFFGDERLAEVLGRMRDRPLETLPTLLFGEALGFSGGVLQDDAALLAVNYLGGGRAANGRAGGSKRD